MTSSSHRDGSRPDSLQSCQQVSDSVEKQVSEVSLRDRLFRGQLKKTFEHRMVSLPELCTEQDELGRRYLTPDGKFPSVTTILGETESKEWIKEWYDRVGIERAHELTKEGADRGTYVHSMIERYLKNERITKGDDPISYFWTFKRIQEFLDRITTIYLLESTVFSTIHEFAGRIDCCADFDGTMSAIDFKNYSAEKTKEQLETAFCQTALYAEAIEEQTTRLGSPLVPKNLVVIFSSKTGASRVKIEPRERYREMALERVRLYYSTRK